MLMVIARELAWAAGPSSNTGNDAHTVPRRPRHRVERYACGWFGQWLVPNLIGHTSYLVIGGHPIIWRGHASGRSHDRNRRSGFLLGKPSGHVSEVTVPIRRGSGDASEQGDQNERASPMEDAPPIFQTVNKAVVRFGGYTRKKRTAERRHRLARWLRLDLWFNLTSRLRLKQLGTAHSTESRSQCALMVAIRAAYAN